MRRNNVIGHSPQIRTYFRRSCQRFESPLAPPGLSRSGAHQSYADHHVTLRVAARDRDVA
jgi:hypothetical protein